MTIKLFISGKGRYRAGKHLSPSMTKAKAILDNSKDGELFTTRQLSRMIGVESQSLLRYSYQVPTYWCNVKSALRYWGKPATVAQLKRETEDDTGHRCGKAAEAKSTRRGA